MKIITATEKDRPIIRELFLEYANSLDFDLGFQGFEEELASLPGPYSSPRGSILLASKDLEVAGCVALRPLGEEISEMKRLYVRPLFQGQGIGRMLTQEILKKARTLGYKKIRLDTVPSMKVAIQMYATLGFYSISPYRENPIPGTTYLEKNLSENEED